jgi:hypothetical protein
VVELDLPVEVQEARGGARAVVDTGQRATAPFSTVGVTWAPDPATGELSVQVRTRSEGAWTPWTSLEAEGPAVLAGAPEEHARGVRSGTEPLYAGDSDGVQVRVEVLSGEAPRDVRLALVDPGSSPADASVTALPASTAHAQAAPRRSAAGRSGGPTSRSAPGRPSYASTLSAVTLHHTASSNDYTAAEVPGLIRGFYAYHVRSQGWSDIGYNVLVDKFGTAWEGRAGGLDKPVIGAHAGGFNTGTVGVSMIGTYGTVEPTAATKEAVAQVSAWKLGLHGRDPRSSYTTTSGGSTRYPSGTVGDAAARVRPPRRQLHRLSRRPGHGRAARHPATAPQPCRPAPLPPPARPPLRQTAARRRLPSGPPQEPFCAARRGPAAGRRCPGPGLGHRPRRPDLQRRGGAGRRRAGDHGARRPAPPRRPGGLPAVQRRQGLRRRRRRRTRRAAGLRHRPRRPGQRAPGVRLRAGHRHHRRPRREARRRAGDR